jgi:type I restriction enzyme S subunit
VILEVFGEPISAAERMIIMDLRAVVKGEVAVFLLQESDFVFARTGGAGTFGVVEALYEPVAYASYLIRFRFSATVFTNFLRYFFLSGCFQNAVRQNIHGGVNQNIHAEDIKNQYLAVPSLDEQQSIAAFLDRETEKLDTLTAESKRGIELLQERRTALISAAVTGKIDVRDLVSTALPEEAAA